jgi:hypothetical protein
VRAFAQRATSPFYGKVITYLADKPLRLSLVSLDFIGRKLSAR